MAALASVGSRRDRAALALNPALPATIVERLSQDREPGVRSRIVLQWPATLARR
jgi:hypothetical protein